MNDTPQARRGWLFLLALAVVAIVLQIQWTRSLAWDEIEFFRATKWVSEGRVPYRDFWEHHMPLQWGLFAPIAAMFGRGPGVGSVIAMRWAQLPLWTLLFVALSRLLDRAGLDVNRRWIAILLPLSSLYFVDAGLEYRIDTLASAAYFAALLIAIVRPAWRWGWISFGLLMSAAVVANMRLAPLIVVTAAVLMFFDGEARRWRWNRSALWMTVGVAVAVSAFWGWLQLTGATETFREAMRFNMVTDRIAREQANTFLWIVAEPIRRIDVGCIALVLGAVVGLVYALKDIRRPGLLQVFALLSVVSIAIVTTHGVHYSYHFQTAILLMAPLAASLARSQGAQRAAFVILAVALARNLADQSDLYRHRVLKHQDLIMRAADQYTTPNEAVWDGVGYALTRRPAFRYWFLPAGVRFMVERGEYEPYDVPQMIANPPAAIIHNPRIHYWLQLFPGAATYATRHYVPLYRNLWLPGLSATLEPSAPVVRWIVPRDGTYRLYASELLARHPWFQRPLQYALADGPNAPLYEVRLKELPLVDASQLRLTVDGAPANNAMVQLRRDSIVELRSAARARVGVLIVDASWERAFIGPEERFP